MKGLVMALSLLKATPGIFITGAQVMIQLLICRDAVIKNSHHSIGCCLDIAKVASDGFGVIHLKTVYAGSCQASLTPDSQTVRQLSPLQCSPHFTKLGPHPLLYVLDTIFFYNFLQTVWLDCTDSAKRRAVTISDKRWRKIGEDPALRRSNDVQADVCKAGCWLSCCCILETEQTDHCMEECSDVNCN